MKGTWSRGGKDERARLFVELTRPHHARLWQLALLLAGDRHDAEDLLQDALLKAYRSFWRFRMGGNAYPWLARILRNTAIDRRRSAWYRHEADAVQRAEHLPSGGPDPERAAIESERRLELERALGMLPAEMAEAVVLVDVQGLSYRQASKVIGAPVGTVRSRLARARIRLRELLSSSPDSAAGHGVGAQS